MKTFLQFCTDEDQRTATRPSVSTLRRRALREKRIDRQGRVLSEIERFTATVLNSPFAPDIDKRSALMGKMLAKLVTERQ